MDWDLGPDDPESSFYVQPEWKCDFNFGCVSDVIEEDALNEKSCIQVLKVLITKADAEIDTLEQDLLSLQCELAWVENKEWSEICSNALREKINCLDISITSLRNKDKNDMEVQILMHTQPVEKLHEILKALLRNYFCNKDEQPKQVQLANILNSSSVVPSQTTNIADERKISRNHTSGFIMGKEMRASSTTGRAASLNPPLKLAKKKTVRAKKKTVITRK